MFPVDWNALTTSHLPCKQETNCCIQRSCQHCSEKGWAGGGCWVKAGAVKGQGQSSSPSPLGHKPVAPEQPAWVWADCNHGSYGLRSLDKFITTAQIWGPVKTERRQDRETGQPGAWPETRTVKTRLRQSPRQALKQALRGKGKKAFHSFPTNLIPSYTAPPF